MRAVALLFLWFVLISFVSILLLPQPRPLKSYNTIGALDYALLVAAPLGAWVASRYRAPRVLFLVYGASCSAALILTRTGGAYGFLSPDTSLFGEIFTDCFLAVTLGVICAAVAQHRYDHSFRLVPRGMCVKCGYDLTGNVSGVCPECGLAVPASRTNDLPVE